MTMQTKPSVRISEDIRRQQGQAIVTVAALPTKPETLEFSLHRYDCFANHLGPRGWQGTACWLAPEEAWYRGEELQFVLRADWVEHLENTTYQLTLRGCGLDEPIAIVFRWPAELAIETDHVEPRRVLGGAQVRTEIGPKPESEINIEPELEPAVELTVTKTSSAATPQPESVDPVSLAPSVAPITHNVTAPAHGNVGTSPRRRSAWGLLLLSGLATTSGLAWWRVQTPTAAQELLSGIAPPSPTAALDRSAIESRVSQTTPAPVPSVTTGDVGAGSTTVPALPSAASRQPTPSASADDLERELRAQFDREELQKEFERRLTR